jgi:hypothetical protein
LHSDHIEIVRLLVEAGANKDKAGTNGFTPLYAACQKGHIKVVRLLVEAGADKEKAANNGHTPLHRAAFHGHDAICMLLTFKGADLTARSIQDQTPADNAQINGHASLAAHLHSSNGVHCLRCTGPSLRRRLLWNDTNQQQQETMLDEMQAQWLARVAEGCAHARVGLTLRGAFSGGLSTCMLLHVMGYVFGGTQVHLQSCISTRRVTQAVAAVDVHGAVVAAAAVGSGRGGSMQELTQHDQEQLPPKLALVSHALALAATQKRIFHSAFELFLQRIAQKHHRAAAALPIPRAGPPVLGDEARHQLQTAPRQGSSSCEWLHAYCDFLQRRYSLGLGQ